MNTAPIHQVQGSEASCQCSWAAEDVPALKGECHRGSLYTHTKRKTLRIIIFPSDGRSPCGICTGNLRCCCLLGVGGGDGIINICGVTSRETINTSLNRCLYNPNEIYIYASCKIFHTSNVNVPTEEVDVTSEAIRKKKISELCGFIFPWGFGPLVIHYRCFDLTSYRIRFYKNPFL